MNKKIKMHTPNRADDNFAKLSALFPNAVTEVIDENGQVVRAIDKDVLMQEISHTVVEGREERYQFTWPDKKKSVLTANAPINKTLRPCREESVNFDTTENLYIEGDNLEVLKLLQETYLGKVKMIYIDPPYNTGNDFVYEDDFAQGVNEYMENSGQYDEDGNRLFKNMDSNGRFHTDWLNMIYPRLKLARDLLTDNGVMFISIDDNEVENLKKCCDEIFGASNAEIYIWDTREDGTMPKTAKNTVRKEHEYLVTVFKTSTTKSLNKYQSYKYENNEWTNPDNDYRGPWMSANISRGTDKGTGGIKSYIIENPIGIKFDRNWSISKEEYECLLADGRIFFADNGKGVPRKKIFKNEPVMSIQSSIFENLKSSQNASKIIENLLNVKAFDFPKPIQLIKRIVQLSCNKNDLIFDFFSGSATTADAVMQLNAEDGGKRKFIMVQLPEVTDEKSEAYKAGYKNICEIGKERIRRAGSKIKSEIEENNTQLKIGEEPKKVPDIGFRVLKCDSSNMKDVYYYPEETEVNMFDDMVSNIKEDRTDEDLLMQVMLDLGVLLSSKIENFETNGKKIFSVADDYLIACFDDNVTDEIVEQIAKKKPYYFVMRDSSLADSSVAVNFEQLFKTYSADTVRMVL